MIKRHTFENGFQLVYQKSEQAIPLTCIHVFCSVGSAFEVEPIRGASHLVEHMCFKGTHAHSKARNLLMEYNKIGAHFNAYTEKRFTTYTVTCDDNHTATRLVLLSDMLLNSSFSKKEFDKEQHVVVEENIRTKDNNSYMLQKALEKIYFKGSSYENPIDIIDYHPTASYLKYEDIVQWYKWFYRPCNMVASIISNMPFTEIVAILKKSQFMREQGASAAQLQLYPTLTIDPITDHFHFMKKKGISATILRIGFRTCAFHSVDQYPLKVLCHILNGFSGRLFTAFRTKRGLTYHSSASTIYHEHSGYFTFDIQTDPKKLFVDGKDSGVLPILITLICDLVKHGITQKELVVAKGNCKGKYLMELQSMDNLATYNGIMTVLKEDDVVFNKLYEAHIANMTCAAVNAVITKYITMENLVTGVMYDGGLDTKKVEEMVKKIW
jgi:hypothetical protein